MKPAWLKRNYACPDCGQIVDENDCPHEKTDHLEYKAFDCERCHAHYSPEEFVALNQDKWSGEHQPEDQP